MTQKFITVKNENILEHIKTGTHTPMWTIVADPTEDKECRIIIIFETESIGAPTNYWHSISVKDLRTALDRIESHYKDKK